MTTSDSDHVEAETGTRRQWSRKKKDIAPRGVFRHDSGAWAVRFTCGAGHIHEEKVGAIKSDAVRIHAARRQRIHEDSHWCPAADRRAARNLAALQKARDRQRVTFEDYAKDYLAWSATVHRAQRTAKYEVGRLVILLGEDVYLDAVSSADVERCLGTLRGKLASASVNRLRDRLSGMFKRAQRLGLVATNPVKGLPKLREAGARIAFLSRLGEAAVLSALPEVRRGVVTLAINTGQRWAEQAGLRWKDVDLLAGFATVRLTKNGHVRRVPLNGGARAALVDLATHRRHPTDPEEPVVHGAYRTVSRDFVRAVRAAQETLNSAGQREEATRLEGVTWHSLRHTFASRLVTAGVDLRTVQELGGWLTLSMVQRYAHLSPGHLIAAVEKIDAAPVITQDAVNSTTLGQNLDCTETGSAARNRESS